jgi:hypothetical protein
VHVAEDADCISNVADPSLFTLMIRNYEVRVKRQNIFLRPVTFFGSPTYPFPHATRDAVFSKHVLNPDWPRAI